MSVSQKKVKFIDQEPVLDQEIELDQELESELESFATNIKINMLDINSFFDNNGNLYFEKDNVQYQVNIDRNNYLYLDKGNYNLLTKEEIENDINVKIKMNLDCDIEMDTFDIVYNNKIVHLPCRKNGLISALYDVKYFKNEKEYIYTQTKLSCPVLMTVQIHTGNNNETFMYSKETGTNNLVKYNLEFDKKLTCTPIHNNNKKILLNTPVYEPEKDCFKIPLGEFRKKKIVE